MSEDFKKVFWNRLLDLLVQVEEDYDFKLNSGKKDMDYNLGYLHGLEIAVMLYKASEHTLDIKND